VGAERKAGELVASPAHRRGSQWISLLAGLRGGEAGLQVPAGTIKANERPEAAVLREAFEETGLPDLMIDGFLGEVERDMSDFGRDEIHHRRFYHLRCEGNPPDTWRHEERDSPDDPKEVPIIFEFFWASLPHDIPPLIADHGLLIPQLLKRL
jgi:8-oxo-dGTP diphosphatase